MSIYASQDDVEPLIKFIADDASDDLYQRVLDNADSWVNARLLSNSLHIWTKDTEKAIPGLLSTAAIYYAASDIILALYNGEEMPTQYDSYFNKAETMLNAYIAQMQEELKNTELKGKNVVRHSKSRSYYQRKGRRPIL